MKTQLGVIFFKLQGSFFVLEPLLKSQEPLVLHKEFQGSGLVYIKFKLAEDFKLKLQNVFEINYLLGALCRINFPRIS